MRAFRAIASSAGLLFCLVSSAFPASAQRGGPSTPAPTQVAVSPDGTTLAWTLTANRQGTLHLTAVANPDPASEKLVAPVTSATACSNGSPVWSPDSQWLAFLSSCTSKEEKPGQEQIFLWSRADGSVKQLTHVTGIFKQAAWSPDGKTLGFLFVENATRSAGALDAMKPWDGVIGEDNLEIQGVYGVDVSTGRGAWIVTPSKDMYVFEFTWSPRGHEVAFIGAPAPGENNWWTAKLYSVSTGGKEHVLLDPNTVHGGMHGLQMAVPRYSPDGKQIAFLGGLMSDFGSNGGDVWVVPAGGGEPVDVTPGIDGTPTFLAWTGNDGIGMVEDRRGHNVLAAYDVATRKQTDVDDLGEVQLSGGAWKNAVGVSTDGVLAFIKSGIGISGEVWAGGWKDFKQITHVNTGMATSAKVESIEWDNEDFHVQGWLVYPKNYDAKKHYPMIVTVHGGPTSSAFPRNGGTNWAELGYFSFQPNPRGSMGQGETFVQANRKDFGYGDLRDILSGVEAVEKKVSIDPKRIGLTGWSYGGFMSMFAATQTGRFAAIVAGAGISNWQSYYGENSIDQWMVPFFGASVYDDPAVYAKSSALNYIRKAAEYKTPMLIVVGDRDGECPAPQSFEMWHALRAVGVKTQLVVYPNEGHGFRNPAHIRDLSERSVRWFAENMPAGR